ncbi:hypothetical protein [Croceibacterium soli]|nr:hypothetical protein [Croceibacterium soli]
MIAVMLITAAIVTSIDDSELADGAGHVMPGKGEPSLAQREPRAT